MCSARPSRLLGRNPSVRSHQRQRSESGFERQRHANRPAEAHWPLGPEGYYTYAVTLIAAQAHEVALGVAPDHDGDVSAAGALHRGEGADSWTHELLAPIGPVERPQGLGAFDPDLGQHHIGVQCAPGDLVMLVVLGNLPAFILRPLEDLGVIGVSRGLAEVEPFQTFDHPERPRVRPGLRQSWLLALRALAGRWRPSGCLVDSLRRLGTDLAVHLETALFLKARHSGFRGAIEIASAFERVAELGERALNLLHRRPLIAEAEHAVANQFKIGRAHV